MCELRRDDAEKDSLHKALTETERRYQTLLETFPDAVICTDNQAKIFAANMRAAEVFGFEEPGDLLGKNGLELLVPGDLEKAQEAMSVTLQNGGGRETLFEVLRRDGARRTLEVSSTVLVDDAGHPEGFLVVARDASVRVSTERALRESEERYRTLLQIIPDAITMTDLKAHIVMANAKAAEIHGLKDPEKLIGRNAMDFIVPEDRSRAEVNLRKTLESGRVDRIEYVLQTLKGTRLPVELSASLLRDDCGQPKAFVGVVRDISERKRLEREVVEVRDREQRRIGQDLHDGLCSHLVGVAFLADAVEKKLALRGHPESKDVAEIAILIRQAVAQARSLARGLSPVSGRPEGLMQALKELAHNVDGRAGISCAFECVDPILIGDINTATHLYRIAQEAANNAVIHGRPSRITLRLLAGQGTAALQVEDDGIGMSLVLGARRGMGLAIMEYRARLIHAALAVVPGPEGGTRVTCLFQHPDAV